MGLSIRKLANKTGDRLPNGSWPLAGIKVLPETPDKFNVSTRYVDAAEAEGWMKRVNPRGVVRPAGPRQDVLSSSYSGQPHTFIHCDEIIFKTVDGDIRFLVVHQPDKYAVVDYEVVNQEKNLVREVIDPNQKVTPEIYAAGQTRVDHYYGLERSDG